MRLASQPTTPPPKRLLRYFTFAALSILANLLVQEAAFRLASGMRSQLAVAVASGTVAGFALKYALDKHLVFEDHSCAGIDEVRKISIYGAFSVATTLVFWGFEAGFWLVFQTSFAKYLGAAVGLTLGYFIKFVLDSRYVFNQVRTTQVRT